MFATQQIRGDEQCPLTGFTVAAFDYTMPPELREVFFVDDASGRRPRSSRTGGDAAAALTDEERLQLSRRLWATLLALARAKSADECFLLKTLKIHGIDETIVCRGMAWVEFMAERFPNLQPRLELLFARAAAYQGAWEARNDVQIAKTREMWNRQKAVRNETDFHRAMGVMAESLMETHETLSTVLTAGGTGLMRWQRVVVLCSLLIGMLTCVIWSPIALC